MSWTKMSKAQQDMARRVAKELATAGHDTTVSQVAKYFEDAMSWRRGDITLAALVARMEA